MLPFPPTGEIAGKITSIFALVLYKHHPTRHIPAICPALYNTKIHWDSKFTHVGKSAPPHCIIDTNLSPLIPPPRVYLREDHWSQMAGVFWKTGMRCPHLSVVSHMDLHYLQVIYSINEPRYVISNNVAF